MNALYIKKSLMQTIFSMSRNPAPFVKNPGRNFTRKRSITFSDLLLFLLTMENHSLNRELRRFFDSSEKLPPTKSALIQQREKLNEKALPYLFSAFNEQFEFKKTFKGYHLLAADGADVNIAPYAIDLLTRVQSNSPDSPYYQLHLNAMFDILENRYTDLILQPRAEYDERAAFNELIDRNPVSGKCIFIADRGYFSANVWAHLQDSGQYYVLRMTKTDFLERFSPPEKGPYDQDISISVTRSKKACHLKNHDIYWYLRPDRRFDYIPPDDKESLYMLSARLVRIILPNGTEEYLLTNLPRTFTKKDLSKIYNLRWGIEVSFRHLKYSHGLVYLHSLRREFIYQEIYAKMIMYNFTSLLARCVKVAYNGTKYKYQIVYSEAVATARDFLIHRFTNQRIKELLLHYRSEIKPDRSFPRKVRSQRYKPFHFRT